MRNEIKCPICGKVGIPDYHKEDITCPQCGSDLSIYRVIDKIPSNGGKTNVWKPISVVAIATAVALGALTLSGNTNNDSTSNGQEVALLDSISTLNNQIKELQASTQEQKHTGSSSAYIYIVRKGDNFWAISKRFYGTGTKYAQIASDNGLDVDATLTVGDTLKIK